MSKRGEAACLRETSHAASHPRLASQPITNRETLRVILSNDGPGLNVVLAGSAAGGVGAFNAARWLLDSFEQVDYVDTYAEALSWTRRRPWRNKPETFRVCRLRTRLNSPG